MTENQTPLTVFNLCRRQWRYGVGGAAGIDGNVVWRVIDEIDAANKLDTFHRVDLLAAQYLHYQRQRQR